ncbi:MAG: ATP-grasp domain-containing protein [Burkholderiales bacterium]|nr:ATP-grasp domain-containing protein [Burkholderiales bacterium]
MSDRQAYRAVLAIRDARALIAASAASQIGDWLYNAALLGYVYAATGSAAWVGAATICRLFPYVLLGPVGGAIADRFSRRSVLIGGDVLRLALMLGLAATVAAGSPVVVVIALTALASAAGSAERPAALALMPRLVGESRLGAANALLHTVQELGIVVGPAIGAILLATGPDWLAFAVNAATFAASAALVFSIRDRSRPRRVRGGTAAQVADGLRAAWKTAFVVPLLLIVAAVEFTYGAQAVQLVVYAERSLDLGAAGYGMLLTASGIGGLASSLVNARLSAARCVAFVVVATAVAACATQLVFAHSSVLVIALAAAAIGGAALVSCEVVAETALARIVPAEALGRVVGVFEAAQVGAMIAGAALAPAAIEATSLQASLVVLGVTAIGVALLARAGLRGLDAATARRFEELASRVRVIEGLPIAQALPRTFVERLASASQLCALPAGVDVVVQGAPAHALFAIVEGEAVVRRNGLSVDRMGPGEVFGERGLLDNAPRNATVTTSSDATLLRIDGEALIEALQAVPALRPALDIGGRGRADPGGPGTSAGARAASAFDRPARIEGATVVVVCAGYPGKRPIYERIATKLGARLVIVDERGHWSERLVGEGVAARWLAATVTGDADVDARAVQGALRSANVQPDGVLTFWEDSVPVAARVAAALGLPGNPIEAVDAARSKLRTRELSARLGLPTPRAVRVRSLDELYAAAADIGFPAVVKPEFGALAVGCVRVDSFQALPAVYRRVRQAVNPEADAIFRAGNDLLLEEYLDGVEFDVDLVLEDGACVFSSVSQNWPTAEPSFQERGLHCPPDHRRRAVRALVAFAAEAAREFGFRTGVLHIEAKSTSGGPRIVEINARMGGGSIHQIVEAVWGVDLIEAAVRSSLGLPQALRPSRQPRCAVVDSLVYAPASGRLATMPLAAGGVAGVSGNPAVLGLDLHAEVGDDVVGPDAIFATPLAELAVRGRDLREARAISARMLAEPPRVAAGAWRPA